MNSRMFKAYHFYLSWVEKKIGKGKAPSSWKCTIYNNLELGSLGNNRAFECICNKVGDGGQAEAGPDDPKGLLQSWGRSCQTPLVHFWHATDTTGAQQAHCTLHSRHIKHGQVRIGMFWCFYQSGHKITTPQSCSQLSMLSLRNLLFVYFFHGGAGVLRTSKQSSKIDKQACINVEALMSAYPGRV